MSSHNSSLYPSQSQGTNSSLTNGGQSTTNRPSRATGQPKQIKQTLVPQAVLLVGYTPEGSPILMTNPTQNTYASLTATGRAQSIASQPPMFENQATIDSSLITAPGVGSAISISQQSEEDIMNTVMSQHQPVMAAPKTILGPDGKPYTALVRINNSADIGPQIIERGLISTGGSYQIIKEPSGRYVRHVFHENAPTRSNIATQRGDLRSSSSHTRTGSGTSDPTGTQHSTPTNTGIYNPTISTNPPIQSSNSSSNLTPSSPMHAPQTGTRSRSSSGSSLPQSPPHPTVQSTADFLRANSSLDTSYCPASNSDLPRSTLIQYVSWDSDISKPALGLATNPQQTNTKSTTYGATNTPNTNVVQTLNPAPSRIVTGEESKEKVEATKPEVVSTSSVATLVPPAASKSVEGVKYEPSKALKYHLSHGGDKGLVDVENPYDEL